ncbi:MAG: sigma-70 family RNA polymerase sigma factor [Myxococcaceae bacterium]
MSGADDDWEDEVPSDVMELPVSEKGAVKAPPSELPEHLLIARLRRKDTAAFEFFVRAHQDRVYDFCVRMLADREEAFDLTQEIFISIHQHLDQFRADAKLTTWIYRIARNHCLNRLKYLKRRGRGRSDEFGESNELSITEAMGGAAQPDDAVHARTEKALVHQAISQLDEDQRALVVLRDVEGLSYEEIMDITELAEGTVKSRLHRAREKLAGILVKLEQSFADRGE